MFPALYAFRNFSSSSFRIRGTVSLVQNYLRVDYSSCCKLGSWLTIILGLTWIQLIFMGGVDVNVLLFFHKFKKRKRISTSIVLHCEPLSSLLKLSPLSADNFIFKMLELIRCIWELLEVNLKLAYLHRCARKIM